MTFTCEIANAGHSGDQPNAGVIMQLKDVKNHFQWRWFGYGGSRQMEFLTIALTALAYKLKVVVDIESDAEWSAIKSIWASRD